MRNSNKPRNLLLLVALAASLALAPAMLAQQREAAQEERPALGAVPTVRCCECLGQAVSVNLSTGQGGNVDPLWKVNGLPAYTTPPVPGAWATLTGANWIQPVASPTPSPGVAAGIYKYSTRVNVPKCSIPSSVVLTGKFYADNSAALSLDNGPIIAQCAGPACFQGTAVPFSVALTPGSHTLDIVVKNNESYSGLIVSAKVTRQCTKE